MPKVGAHEGMRQELSLARERSLARRVAHEPSTGELRLRDALRAGIVYEVEVRNEQLITYRPVFPPEKPGVRPRACHEALAGSPAACVGCPALASGRAASPRREAGVLSTPSGPYRVAFAEPLGSGRFRVQMVQLSETLVSTLQRQRVDRRARAAGLSKRELGVLDLLLLGRTSAEVARALGITERTARFHVANILRKLEADSRADLLRLLL